MALRWNELWQVFTTGLNDSAVSTWTQLQNPSLANPFTALLLVCVSCFVLEALLSPKLRYPLVRRPGFKLDLFYVFFMDFALMPLGFYALLLVMEQFFLSGLAAIGFRGSLWFSVKSLPGPAQFAILFAILDFTTWLAHYAIHRFDFLWQFHKIHHAQEDLGFASTRHFHWAEYWVFKSFAYLPLHLIGFTPEAYLLASMWVGYGLAFLSHANIRVQWGILNHLIITPDTHYWHHAKNVPHRYGVNFASGLVLWDKLFGCFYLPKDATPLLGIENDDVPKHFWGQQIYPFRRHLRIK